MMDKDENDRLAVVVSVLRCFIGISYCQSSWSIAACCTFYFISFYFISFSFEAGIKKTDDIFCGYMNVFEFSLILNPSSFSACKA